MNPARRLESLRITQTHPAATGGRPRRARVNDFFTTTERCLKN